MAQGGGTYWYLPINYILPSTIYSYIIALVPRTKLAISAISGTIRLGSYSYTPVAESALRFDKKVPQGNFFRSYTLSRGADLLVHTADLISTI